MKRLIPIMYIITVAIALFGCKRHSDARLLLDKAEAMMEDHPDSALAVLETINKGKINDDQDYADYGLLYTIAKYKCYKSISVDTLLTPSIDYYMKNNDYNRLANALYYKGAILCDTNLAMGIECLKRAETLAEKIDDKRLKSKIYYNLAYFNEDSIRISYCVKLLKTLSPQTTRKLKRDVYSMLSVAYHDIGDKDGEDYFLNRSLKMSNTIADKENKSILYSNLADLYMEKGDLMKSMKYAKKSIEQKANTYAYITLGQIACKNNDAIKSREYFEKAISNAKRNKDKLIAYKSIADFYTANKDYDDAVVYLNHYIETENLEDSISQKRAILEIQAQYDKSETERLLYWRTLIFVVILITVGLLVFILVLFHKKKERQLRLDVTYYSSKIVAIETNIKGKENELKELAITSKSKTREINRLSNDLKKLRVSMLEEIQHGFELYQKIGQRKSISNFTDDDINSLIDFCRVAKPTIFCSWEKKYQDLNLRNYLFLIVEDLPFLDCEKAEILGIAESSLRSMRTRIKKKQKA